MKELIESFSHQIKQGLEIYQTNQPTCLKKTFKNVVISGLGGSGIGGTIVKDLSMESSSIPVVVNKSYTIPGFVNEDTLFIASSYSGNTEETIAAVNAALAKNASVVCITSGGELESLANSNNLDKIIIPGGHPPRACLGYSLTCLICIFSDAQLIPSGFVAQLSEATDSIQSQQTEISKKAEEIARSIFNKRVVIYSDSLNEGLAIRLRQQLNENSKLLAWHHVVPEMNHNELVGWSRRSEDHAVLILRTQKDNPRNQQRIELNKNILSKYCPTIIDIWGTGDTYAENLLSLIHLSDWISYHLALLNGVDIMDIKVIDYLKSELAKNNLLNNS